MVSNPTASYSQNLFGQFLQLVCLVTSANRMSFTLQQPHPIPNSSKRKVFLICRLSLGFSAANLEFLGRLPPGSSLYSLLTPCKGNSLNKIAIKKGINHQGRQRQNHRSRHNIVPITDVLPFKSIQP